MKKQETTSIDKLIETLQSAMGYCLALKAPHLDVDNAHRLAGGLMNTRRLLDSHIDAIFHEILSQRADAAVSMLINNRQDATK